MTSRRSLELQLAELSRALNAARLHSIGVTPEHGVPTPLADGIHIAAATDADLAALRRLNPHRKALVPLRTILPPNRLAVFQAAQLLQDVHRCDVTVPNGYLPQESSRSLDFGEAFLVTPGMAVGHLLLFDSRGTPGRAV